MTDFVVAEAQIRQLYARYAESIWRSDADAFGDCLKEDVEWRISGHIMKGREAAQGLIRTVFPKFRWCSISFKQPLVEVTGEGTAIARTFFNEQSVFASGRTFTAMGVYHDRIVACDDGRWRFAWRLFQAHYAGSPDLSGPLFKNPDFGAFPSMPPLDAPTYDHSGTLAN